jgi:hypothetical protein
VPYVSPIPCVIDIEGFSQNLHIYQAGNRWSDASNGQDVKDIHQRTYLKNAEKPLPGSF